jgi:hypothetical protein
MAVGTGHGATIAFTTSTTFVPLIVSIDGAEESRPRLDTSHLATTSVRSFIPGDLRELSTFSVTVLANPSTAAVMNVPFVSTPETITITLGKTVSASAAGANYAGTGFIVSRTLPSVVTDNLLSYTFDISWASQPTFTAEA